MIIQYPGLKYLAMRVSLNNNLFTCEIILFRKALLYLKNISAGAPHKTNRSYE